MSVFTDSHSKLSSLCIWMALFTSFLIGHIITVYELGLLVYKLLITFWLEELCLTNDLSTWDNSENCFASYGIFVNALKLRPLISDTFRMRRTQTNIIICDSKKKKCCYICNIEMESFSFRIYFHISVQYHPLIEFSTVSEFQRQLFKRQTHLT